MLCVWPRPTRTEPRYARRPPRTGSGARPALARRPPGPESPLPPRSWSCCSPRSPRRALRPFHSPGQVSSGHHQRVKPARSPPPAPRAAGPSHSVWSVGQRSPLSGLGREGGRLLWGRVRTQPVPCITGTRGHGERRRRGASGCRPSAGGQDRRLPLTVQFRSIERQTAAFLGLCGRVRENVYNRELTQLCLLLLRKRNQNLSL